MDWRCEILYRRRSLIPSMGRHPEDMIPAIGYKANARIKVNNLVTDKIKLDDFEKKGTEKIEEGSGVKVLVRPM